MRSDVRRGAQLLGHRAEVDRAVLLVVLRRAQRAGGEAAGLRRPREGERCRREPVGRRRELRRHKRCLSGG